MKVRAAGVVTALAVLLLLILAVLKTESGLLDIRSFQFDSKLFYIITVSVALGALFMFVLFVFFPSKGMDIPPRKAIAPPPRMSSRIREAEVAIRLGDMERGIELLEAIPSGDPEYWNALKRKADLALAMDHWEDAEKLYRRSLDAAGPGEKPFVMLDQAEFYAGHGMRDRALELYREIVRVEPQGAVAAFSLREHYLREKDWEEALVWQEHLEDHFPDLLSGAEEANRRIGIRYSLALAEFERGSLDTAQALLKHISRLTDSFVPAYLLAGEILERENSDSAAMKMWERGFRGTGSPAVLQRIGEFLLSQGLPEKAIEFVRDAAILPAAGPEYEYCLADLYMKMEMTAEAMKILQRIEQRYPEWMVVRKLLADLYRKNGQVEKAYALLSTMLEQAEDSAAWRLWACDKCNTTHKTYQACCEGCGNWNSVRINWKQAGKEKDDYGSPAVVY